MQPEAYDPKLDVDFTPLRKQDLATAGLGRSGWAGLRSSPAPPVPVGRRTPCAGPACRPPPPSSSRASAAPTGPRAYLCAGCYAQALETYGTCTGCGVDRLTPGLAPDGGKLCTDYADGLGNFTCERCGQEARRYRRGICGRCVLAERLHELLDDGTGRIRPELLPLFDTLRQMRRPWGGLTWTNQPHVQQNLQALARNQVPLTHEGLSQLTPWRSVAYLRDLLMQCGVLPPADRHLLLFQRLLAEKLPTVSDPEHRKLLDLFATWHIQRRLRTLASRGLVTGSQTQQARNKLYLAINFLDHIAQRGRALADCTQADVDTWYAGGYTARRLTHSFLRWAMQSKHMPTVTIPHRSTANPKPITQHQRLALPLTRITRPSTDDVQHENGKVLVRLGDPPSPVPAPFDGMLLNFLEQRPNTKTATNPDARWLFPGRRAGQPMTPEAWHPGSANWASRPGQDAQRRSANSSSRPPLR
ncbi:hypothetical protein ACFVW1_50380 [Streptomyces olivochromogenes]|uniref:hypothetical protein n=1 Tax=Streptomyces olivochromogenes TaxID=1963 RepID=UPI0036D83D36